MSGAGRVKRWGLKVPARAGEEVLKALRALGLMERGLKVVREGGSIVVPLKSDAPEEVVRRVASEFGGEVVEAEFRETLLGKKYKDLLKGLVPEEVLERLPSSFDIVGEAALIQLPPEAEPYGRLVADAIMKVARNVKGVYAVGPVSGEFRVRPVKLIGGEDVGEVVHREYGVRVKVDLRRAYYNPSLAEEHRRVAELVKDGEVVADLFCGVGPFTLHIITLRNAVSYAVDLNPHAIKCLLESLELNARSLRGRAIPTCGDVLDFLRITRDGVFDRVVMNLPHKAVNYLPDVAPKVRCGGVIHVYVVSRSEAEALNKVEGVGSALGLMPEGVRRVLDYAPRKWVFRVDVRKACR